MHKFEIPALKVFREKHSLIFIESVVIIFLILLFGEVIAVFYNPWGLGENQNLKSPESIIHYVRHSVNGNSYALVLGDSVLGSSALAKRGVQNSHNKSLASYLKKFWEKEDNKHPFVGLSMDGALLNDYKAIINLLIDQNLTPSIIFLQINYRTFSSVHNNEDHLSRKWLKQFILPASFDQQSRLIENDKLWGMQIDGILQRKLFYNSDLYLLFRGKLKQFLRSNSLKFWSDRKKKKDQNIFKHGISRLRIARYYNSDKNNFEEGIAINIFEVLLDGLKVKNIPVLILLTPTNTAFFEHEFNSPFYFLNINYLKSWFKKRYGDTSNLSLVYPASQVNSEHFFDHVHMTENGNRIIAEYLFKKLEFVFETP